MSNADAQKSIYRNELFTCYASFKCTLEVWLHLNNAFLVLTICADAKLNTVLTQPAQHQLSHSHAYKPALLDMITDNFVSYLLLRAAGIESPCADRCSFLACRWQQAVVVFFKECRKESLCVFFTSLCNERACASGEFSPRPINMIEQHARGVSRGNNRIITWRSRKNTVTERLARIPRESLNVYAP